MERLKSNIVGPSGPLDAEICFIGQSPGSEENDKRRPFVSPSGRVLDQCLRVVGVNRASVLFNNVFKQQPPNNNINYYFQDKSNTKLTWEGQEHVDLLKEWLEDLLKRRNETGEGPNILVALGAEALYILTGKTQISKWRGSLLPCTLVPGFKVYGTYHPSAVMRSIADKKEASELDNITKETQQNYYPLFLKDLQRIERQSHDPELVYPKREGRMIDTVQDAIFELNNLMNVDFSCDIETLGGFDGPILWFIGFSPKPEYGFTIPFLKNLVPKWTIQEEAQIITMISKVFLQPNTIKIFQNGGYDLSVLGRYYGLRLADGTFRDTMLCHHASYPTLKKGLDTLTSIHTWEPYYKDEGKVINGKRASDLAEGSYNIKDCCVTKEIYPLLEQDAKELDTYTGYQRTLKCFPPLLYMQIRGVRIDLEQKQKLTVDFSARAEAAYAKVKEITGKEYNLNSPKQMVELLYGALHLPIMYNNATGKASTDIDALNKLSRKCKVDSPAALVIKSIKEFKKFNKLVSTYTEMQVDSDNRIHTTYLPISTYRLSSAKSPFGSGGNLQNIPVRSEEGMMVRTLFIPDEGLEFTASDLEQAEAREVAWMSNDVRLIEFFQTPGYDVHWYLAKQIFEVPQDVPYDNPNALYKSRFLGESYTLKFYRRIGKTVKHASNYKMGPYKLQTILIRENVYFSYAICKALLDKVKRENPLTTQWQNKVIEQLHATRTIVTPLGRKRIFMGRIDDEMERSAVAFGPQSTVGEITQLAIENMTRNCTHYEQLLNVHDEMLGQNRPEDRKLVYPIMKRSMEITHTINGRDLTIPCSFKRGPSWGNMKEYKYEDLMKE